MLIGNVRNRRHGFAFQKWRYNELRVEYIQLVLSNAPGKSKRNPQQPVSRPKARETKVIAGNNQSAALGIGVVKEKRVHTGEPHYFPNQFPIVSLIATLLTSDAVDVNSNPELFHPGFRRKGDRLSSKHSKSISGITFRTRSWIGKGRIKTSRR